MDELRDYQWREFEMWVQIECPDLAEEFEALPKTLVGFAAARYPYLFEEYNKQSFVQIVYGA